MANLDLKRSIEVVAYMQKSPISFPREAKGIGDVCTQAIKVAVTNSSGRKFHFLIKLLLLENRKKIDLGTLYLNIDLPRVLLSLFGSK